MLINSRHFFVIAVAILMLSSCGDDNTPSSAASKVPQEPAGKAVVAPAETPPATTPAQESTETTNESAVSPAMNEPVPAEATIPATAETQTTTQPEVLTNNVVYQEEIYKNWPSTAAPQPEAAPGVSEVVENKVATVISSIEKKVETVATAVEEKAGTTATAVAGLSPQTAAGGSAQTHVINAEARVFNSDIAYIQPGDTVQWTNMTSHNSVSIDGMIPAGATPWQGQLGENLQVTLTVAGIYGYYCQPHIGFGMMGVIVVGKPTNLEEVKAYADKNLQGPFRRILGKLNKVVIQ